MTGRRLVARFSVLGRPKPKGRPRFSRKHGRAFTDAKTRRAEETFVEAAQRHAPPEPLDGALLLVVTFHVEVPAGLKGWRREAALAGAIRPKTRPDLDNYVKLVKDALNGIYWTDDSRVVEAVPRKVYGTRPRTVVQLYALAEPQTKKEWASWPKHPASPAE